MKKSTKSHDFLVIQQRFPNVKRRIDAKTDILLEVTAVDSRRAKRKNHQSCGLAQCAMRTMDIDGVVARRSILDTIKGDLSTRYVLSEAAKKALIGFDRGLTFPPGQYLLKKPWAGNKMVNKYPPQKTKHVGARGPRVRVRHITDDIRAIL